MEFVASGLEIGKERLIASWHTLPPTVVEEHDPVVYAAIAVFAAVILPLGMKSGFLQTQVVTSPAKWAEVIFIVFFSRGLVEELVFRVLLLPHPAVDGPTPPLDFALKSAFAIFCFVFFHLLIPGEKARKTYWNPEFWGMAAGLGALCSFAYFMTGGSLLVIWLVHGVPVATWLLLLGGVEKVQS